MRSQMLTQVDGTSLYDISSFGRWISDLTVMEHLTDPGGAEKGANILGPPDPGEGQNRAWGGKEEEEVETSEEGGSTRGFLTKIKTGRKSFNRGQWVEPKVGENGPMYKEMQIAQLLSGRDKRCFFLERLSVAVEVH
ncbi:uncharacterized protein PHA67_012856 [Liasis olivaceus]